MNTNKKIILIASVIILLSVGVIIGRLVINATIQKQISIIRPTEVVSYTVKKNNFYDQIDTFGTALANQSYSIRIKKSDIISSVEFDKNLFIEKNQIIANTKNETIAAPFSGRLGIREITPGILGGEQSIIATLDDISYIKIDANIPENYLPALKKNLKVKITSNEIKDEFIGNIETISARIDPTTRSVLIQVKVKNSENKIIPGMLLDMSIRYNERSALEVPQEAIVQSGEDTTVFKIVDGKTVSLTSIKVGLRDFERAEVISGLSEGETIVKEGVSKLRDKALIKVSN